MAAAGAHVAGLQAAQEPQQQDVTHRFNPDTQGIEPVGAQQLQEQLNAAVRDELAAFMREQQRILEKRQAEVDSPEEYARVSTACGRASP